ncbi:MAG TPA: ABC transporter substrate-binding protein, partial [Chloroflexia bacterium]|nr:ABC transporter substrate-binding protein [Chloroflexia bacterium]
MWSKARKSMSLLVIMSIMLMMLAACGDTGAQNTPTIPAGAVATDTATGGGGGEATAMPTTGGGEATAMPTEGGGEATAAPTEGAGGGGGMPTGCTGNVELTYWTPFTGPDGPFMQGIVDSFNSANPNIKVTMNTIPGAEYGTQLGTAAASDTLPDVAIINEDQVATQAFRNVLRPIPDNVATIIGATESDFPAVAWGAGTVAGNQYALPLSFVAMTAYYNEDLFKAAGIAGPPTNKAEFEDAAQKLTTGGNNGFLLTNGFPVQQIFQQLLHQYGGQEFSDDGQTATWNSEAGVQALTWMKEAQTKYGQPNLEVDAELNAFKGGTVGMVWNGIWQVPNLTGEAVEFTGKAAPVPQIGDQPAVWAGGPLLALPTKANPDECKDAAAGMFIGYVLDNSLEWAKAGNIPAKNSVRESAEFKALPHAAVGPSVANPVFPPSIPGVGDAFAPLGEAVGAVMAGTETDIKKALDGAAERSNTVLADNRNTFGDAPTQ